MAFIMMCYVSSGIVLPRTFIIHIDRILSRALIYLIKNNHVIFLFNRYLCALVHFADLHVEISTSLGQLQLFQWMTHFLLSFIIQGFYFSLCFIMVYI